MIQSAQANQVMRRGYLDRVVRFLLIERTVLLLLVLVGVSLFYALAVSYFWTYPNLAGSSAYAVELGLLALAELIVIVTGGGAIDLSVGSTVSLTSVFLGELLTRWHVPLWPAVVLTLLFALGLGSINAFFIAIVGLPALLVTLATLYAYSAIALVVTSTVPISNLPSRLLDLGLYLHQIPRQTLIVFIPVIAVVWLVLRFTVAGRYLYALGTNAVAARFAAAPVVLTRFSAFAVSGLLAGIAAIVTTARFASARPDAGYGYEFPAITMAVLGGVAITGGVGGVGGVVMATLLITVVNNGMNIAGIDPIWQQLALGLILIGSAILNSFAQRRYGVT